MVATEVVIDFGLATTHRINRHAEARRPLTRERVLAARADEAARYIGDLCACRADRCTVNIFLLPPETEDTRDVLVEAPGILHVGGVVAPEGVETVIVE